MKKIIYTILLLVLGIAGLSINQIVSSSKFEKIHKIPFHPGLSLPDLENDLFATSGTCETCHGEGSLGPNPLANTDPEGNDISPVSLWQSTMMANSSKDPFWQAKVSHEKLVNPSLAESIENTCIKCHAPIGKFNAMHNSIPYTLDSLKLDPIGLDGVSCLACHAMTPDGLGAVFSAQMTYDTNHIVYGQYTAPFVTPMESMIGFTPTYGAHVSSAAACGACHTLITSPVNDLGVSLDTFFVEQAIYHEWLNSIFSEDNVTCQDCHMPKTTFDVTIANRPPWLSARPNFAKHDLVGANVFMLNLLGNNIDTLGITASSSDFELTIKKTEEMLQNNSLVIDLGIESETTDSIVYYVDIENLVGHKFPSGYPSRRLIVEFLVQDADGDTIFHSGKFNDDYSLIGENVDYEPHFDTIRNENDIQIYEMVMGDFNGNVTTVLELAYANLKDNRLVPEGFSTSHFAYDTAQIVGNAASDLNFNSGSSGKDVLFYKIKKAEDYGQWVVTTRFHYQSIPPKWVENMFSYTSPEIDLFKYLFDQNSIPPTIVASAQLNGFQDVNELELNLSVFPNPANEFMKIIASKRIKNVELYDLKGALLYYEEVNSLEYILKRPIIGGTFLLRFNFDGGQIITKKIHFTL